MTWLWSLVSVLSVSAVSLVGLLTLSMNEARVRRQAMYFVSFAVGALLGDAFLHLIPEAFAEATRPGEALTTSAWVLGGMMTFFLVEKLLRHTHGVLHGHAHHAAHEVARPELAAINILGDVIHNFIDGLLIGVSYLASPALGVSTTLAVLLHELPQELGDFAILIHSGLSVRRAVLLNLATASVAILGTVTALLIGSVNQPALLATLIPVTAGGFIYLASADLIPELQHDRSRRALFVQSALMLGGIAVMGALRLVG
jgi:zinc and cadmium transporter